MAKIGVRLKFLLSRGKTVYIREEEVRLREDVPIGRLLEAIQKAFSDIPEVKESEDLSLFVPVDLQSRLSDYYLEEGDTLIVVPAMEQLEDLVERERSSR